MLEYDGVAPLGAGTTNVSVTGNQNIDGLLGGVRWTATTVTYSFPDAAMDYDTNAGAAGVQYGYADEANNGFNPLNAYQIAAARAVFDMAAAVSGLTFVEMTGAADRDATIRLAESEAPSTAWAYLPHPSEEGGDVWFNTNAAWYETPALGTYGFHTFLHEIGHALGLKHGHETGGNGAMTAARDSMEYSVMTYRSYEGGGLSYTNEAGGYAQTLMMYDIAALQHMYGANYDYNAGNTTYRWDPTTGELSIDGEGQGSPYANRIFMTMWDGGGIDTYDLSNYGGGVRVDLRAGGESVFSVSQLARLGSGQYAGANVYNALLHNGNPRGLIENAVGGAGDDTIIGNMVGNFLRGGAGRDVMYGNGGADVLWGGVGNDRMFGGAHHDRIWGGNGFDVLVGGWGNDQLYGGLSGDLLIGGWGDDILHGGFGRDVFKFFGNDGRDTILDFTAGDDRINVHHLGVAFDQFEWAQEVDGAHLFIGGVEIILAGLDWTEMKETDFIF